MLSRTDILEKINNFLDQPRKSQGGYAEITDEDVMALNQIIALLIQAKCESDPDGDYPIDWKLIDRRKCWPMHYSPVPYGHKAKNQQDLEEIFYRCALPNLRQAMVEVENTCMQLHDSRNEG